MVWFGWRGCFATLCDALWLLYCDLYVSIKYVNAISFPLSEGAHTTSVALPILLQFTTQLIRVHLYSNFFLHLFDAHEHRVGGNANVKIDLGPRDCSSIYSLVL